MTPRPEAFFLPVGPDGDQRFCLFHRAHGPAPRGRVVYVHPFAEEMNKSRRMAALQSRALAAAGFSVLQIDLLGCGDSSGDFGDASWAAWVADVRLASRWLRERDAAHAAAPPWLWGLRAGCLLAVEATDGLDEPVNFCFWQPATSGKQLLQQFLRMRVAAEMMSGAGKGLMEDLRQQLATGTALEIAGYRLAPRLAEGLERAQLLPPPASPDGRLVWLELSTQAEPRFSPVAEQAQARWRDAGWQLDARLIKGPAFWQTTEIEEAPALLSATTSALQTRVEQPA
ncbi:hydrolase 2, exosortase A system-associated [Roseateles violae]|uniref:Hydrolase 2, exosortase A system-associated n=1 Tax=Roseateles violae TaxID=3058042 RepID=A0ABT8DR29_9BURK|nr:hydrolase 2, exosortase A system-associated [Pelomonas sp. PFR6]MDN3920481.1 hydrolase 2, exosortase A system-associated [Pelomonas sp. PFR6]